MRIGRFIAVTALTVIAFGGTAASASAFAISTSTDEVQEETLTEGTDATLLIETRLNILVPSSDPAVAEAPGRAQQQQAAERRAREIAQNLSQAEVKLLRGGEPVWIEVDLATGTYASVVAAPGFTAAWLSEGSNCSAGAYNLTCLSKVPTTGIRLSGTGTTNPLHSWSNVTRVSAPTNRGMVFWLSDGSSWGLSATSVMNLPSGPTVTKVQQ